MNDAISKAAEISDAVAAFFENPDFKEKIKGKGTFSIVSMMLRDFPEESMNLICKYHGVDRDAVKDDANEIYSLLTKALNNTIAVFQH